MKGLWLLVLGLFIFAGSAYGAGYRLKEKAVVDGPVILLRDVLDPLPPDALGRVKVGNLGRPGSSTTVPRDLVLLRMRKFLKAPAPPVQGAGCLVTASRREIPGADLLKFGRQAIEAQVGSLTPPARVQIVDPPMPASLFVPDRPVVLGLESSHRGVWRGRVILRIAASQKLPEGAMAEVASTTLSFLVKVECPQVTASRLIRRGEAIGPANVSVAMRDVTYQQEDGYSDPAACTGLTARLAIQPGSVLAPGMLEMPFIVKRGDLLKLKVKSGRVSVEAMATALRDGRKGDVIPVEVADSHKKVNATVLGPGQVEANKP